MIRFPLRKVWVSYGLCCNSMIPIVNHKEHQEHKEAKMLNLSFVLFVFFVVND